MNRRLFLLFAGLLLSQSPLQAACIAPIHFHLTSEGPWKGHGGIEQGRTCNGYYRTGRIATFRRLYLTEPPLHGTLLLHEGGTWSYTAPTGFTGSDPFMLRICGTEGLITGCSKIVYDMAVR
jgi:Bacterial Ig domain